jgi:hypothetical protein
MQSAIITREILSKITECSLIILWLLMFFVERILMFFVERKRVLNLASSDATEGAVTERGATCSQCPFNEKALACGKGFL